MITVDYLVLADAVAAAEGKHYIHGGGWDTIYALTFPVVHPTLSMAVRLRVPWEDTNQPHAIRLDVVDGAGNSILKQPIQVTVNVGRPPHIPPTRDQVVPLALQVGGIPFSEPGSYAVTFKVNGADASKASFHVVQASVGQPSVIPIGPA